MLEETDEVQDKGACVEASDRITVELNELKKEHGIEEHEGKISRVISGFFERKDAKEQILLSKKKYILL